MQENHLETFFAFAQTKDIVIGIRVVPIEIVRNQQIKNIQKVKNHDLMVWMLGENHHIKDDSQFLVV